MQKILATLAASLLAASSSIASEGHGEMPMHADPILSVADFNGDGKVNWKDSTKIKFALLEGKYIAFYDRNADRVFNWADVQQTRAEYGLYSTQFDQEKAALFSRLGHLQGKDRTWASLVGWQLFTPSLAGHGEHWVRQLLSMDAYQPDGQANFDLPMGLNMATEGRDETVGLYWGEAATPMFMDPDSPTGMSTLDWPEGEAWKDAAVMMFGDAPPQFTSSHEENWHTHGGLCLTTDPETNELTINQHMTYNDCQALPNAKPQLIGFDGLTPIYINIHVNTWMVHMWLFDLNPMGFFAGTHPRVDPNALSEDTINGDRTVPPWFQDHHGGGHGGAAVGLTPYF